MKLPVVSAILALGIFILPQAFAVDFVRQIQLINGQTVVYDIPIGNTTGTVRSKPLQGQGAIFQLYAYEDPIYSPFTLLDAAVGNILQANVALGTSLIDLTLLGIHLNITLGNDPSTSSLPKLLAEKTVGAFIPQATIQITSADPYLETRTRADQPFNMVIAIGKLPKPDSNPPAGVPTKVKLARSYKLYHPTLHVPMENGSGQGTYDQAYEFNLNGTFTFPGLYQNLPGESPTQVMGEETFTATVKVGANNSDAQIASKTVKIWPVGAAEIQGLVEGKIYPAPPENLRVSYINAYPASDSYVQIYKGEPQPNKSGTIIASSMFPLNSFEPQSSFRPIAEFAESVVEDGTYTMEVMTVTPFKDRKPERLTYTTFKVKRSMEVRGSVSTME